MFLPLDAPERRAPLVLRGMPGRSVWAALLCVCALVGPDSAAAGQPPRLTRLLVDGQWKSNLTEAVAGKTSQFTFEGEQLKKVTELAFTPPAGITVANLKASKKQVTADVTVPANVFGKLSATAISSDGRSNELELQVRGVDPSFVIENLRAEQVNTGTLPESITIPVAFDFKDPSGGVLRGSLSLRWTLVMGVKADPNVMVFGADGKRASDRIQLRTELRRANGQPGQGVVRIESSPDGASGVVTIELTPGMGVEGFPKKSQALMWIELPRRSAIPFHVALESESGRMSNELATVLQTP